MPTSAQLQDILLDAAIHLLPARFFLIKSGHQYRSGAGDKRGLANRFQIHAFEITGPACSVQGDRSGVIGTPLWHNQQMRSQTIQFGANPVLIPLLKGKDGKTHANRDSDPECGDQIPQSLPKQIRQNDCEPGSHLDFRLIAP